MVMAQGLPKIQAPTANEGMAMMTDHGGDGEFAGLEAVETKGPVQTAGLGDNSMYINYYIKRKDYTMKDNTIKSVYEFHGNCFNDFDTTTWT